MGAVMPGHEKDVRIVFEVSKCEQDELVPESHDDDERCICQEAAVLLEQVWIANFRLNYIGAPYCEEVAGAEDRLRDQHGTCCASSTHRRAPLKSDRLRIKNI